jgi:hypothetical protein
MSVNTKQRVVRPFLCRTTEIMLSVNGPLRSVHTNNEFHIVQHQRHNATVTYYIVIVKACLHKICHTTQIDRLLGICVVQHNLGCATKKIVLCANGHQLWLHGVARYCVT